MSKIITKNDLLKIYWWLGFILAYIILFEFLIPNAVFPKPSILYESVLSLQRDYDILFNLFYSLSGIYFSLIISFLLLNYSSGIWISFLEKKYPVTGFLKSFLFFPLIGLLLAFIYNFPVSVISEYVLWIIVSFVFLLSVLESNLKNMKREYIDSFQSVTVGRQGMIQVIKWKLMQPEVFNAVKNLHIYLWSVVIIFEFLKNHFGVGHIYNMAYQYKDYSGILALSFIVMLIISLGNLVIVFLKQKYFFWEQ